MPAPAYAYVILREGSLVPVAAFGEKYRAMWWLRDQAPASRSTLTFLRYPPIWEKTDHSPAVLDIEKELAKENR